MLTVGRYSIICLLCIMCNDMLKLTDTILKAKLAKVCLQYGRVRDVFGDERVHWSGATVSVK